MSFELGWEARGVIVTYAGTLFPDEVLECHQLIAGDRRFDDLRFAIVDTLSVRSMSFSRSDIERIDAFLQGPAWTNPNIRVVFVATLPEVLQALAIYQAICSYYSYKPAICSSIPAARVWLAKTAPSTPSVRPRR